MIGRCLNLVAREEFTQVFIRHAGASVGLTIGQTVIVAGNLRLGGRQGIDLEGNLGSLFKGFRMDAGEVKGLAAATGEEQQRHGRDGRRGHHGGGGGRSLGECASTHSHTNTRGGGGSIERMNECRVAAANYDPGWKSIDPNATAQTLRFLPHAAAAATASTEKTRCEMPVCLSLEDGSTRVAREHVVCESGGGPNHVRGSCWIE